MNPFALERDEAVVLEPASPAVGVIVWLHGLGADGHDFVPLARALALTQRGLRVVLPHAPERPVTINGGYVMRAWYDVRNADFARDPDEVGIRESIQRVTRILAGAAAGGIPSTRIVIAGFSQGGVIALEAGLRYPQPLAGVIGLSTYLALPNALPTEAAAANRDTSLLLGHGEYDPIIPLVLGEATAARLAQLGYRVELRRYRMAHAVCDAEAADLDRWLRGVLG